MEAIVDRIEGESAVLEIDGKSFEDVPLAKLPVGTRQGDVLVGGRGSWELSASRRNERLAENGSLMDELFED